MAREHKEYRSKARIYADILARSPQGAAAWSRAFVACTKRIVLRPLACSIAPENAEFDFELRQALFKTRYGVPYRCVFTVADDEGRILALVPDGARHRSLDREYQHTSRWEGAVLEVEIWYDDGLHVRETFELAPEESLLTVSFLVDDGSDPVRVERVYRLAPQARS